MKLKINKASDLSSISVFPPQTRRLSTAPTGPQQSQIRSQSSQQSFSQGLSSQHGIFSQLSQSSLDEVVPNDQRVNSQERENSVKRFSCLPPVYTREESQMPMSRSSTNMMRKWNPSSTPDQRCQISEELDRRIGMMETSLSRFGMILDSVQSDVVQVNRVTKEVALEMEDIRQKLVTHDTSLQIMNKAQEDIKASLDGSLKSLVEQLGKDIYEDKFKEIFLVLSTLPEQIEASLLKLQNELRDISTKEMKGMACSLKNPEQKNHVEEIPSQKGTCSRVAPQRKRQPQKCAAVPPVVPVQAIQVKEVKPRGCRTRNSAKSELAASKGRVSNTENKRKAVSSVRQAREREIIIDSDEEIDGGFLCLINEKRKGNANKLTLEVKEETERILRYARKQRRQLSNAIQID